VIAADPSKGLQSPTYQGLYLYCDNLKRAVRNALRSRLNTLHQQVSGCPRGHFVKAEQLVRSDRKSRGNPNKRGKVRFPVSADIVCIAPFTETTTPSGLSIRDAKFTRSVLQISAKRFHENVLFWNPGCCHELIGASGETVSFRSLRHAENGIWRDAMRVISIALLLGLAPSWAVGQSREGLCDLSLMVFAEESQVSSLLSQTGDPFVRCYDGYTPLHVAVSASNLTAIRQLVEAGSDLNARNDFGSTPLHVAILGSNSGAVELLLDLGANIHAAGPAAMSPLEFARHWGEEEIVHILASRGASM